MLPWFLRPVSSTDYVGDETPGVSGIRLIGTSFSSEWAQAVVARSRVAMMAFDVFFRVISKTGGGIDYCGSATGAGPRCRRFWSKCWSPGAQQRSGRRQPTTGVYFGAVLSLTMSLIFLSKLASSAFRLAICDWILPPSLSTCVRSSLFCSSRSLMVFCCS